MQPAALSERPLRVIPHTVADRASGHADQTGRTDLSVLLADSEAFVRLVHEEVPALGPVEDRLRGVRAEIEATGTYRHTATELQHGARMAWRNSARCIGRLYWRSLVVRDRREVTDSERMADECVEHLRIASNDGKVRPVLTVFPPAGPGDDGPRIWNRRRQRAVRPRAAR